eukprot:GHVR01034032.1.p1 GENE.GHVR01034032.1~~GHVR01034032.1.p1  ORF type:complete len:210 (+),score=45.77 GHVR01034032.1:105-734(+)
MTACRSGINVLPEKIDFALLMEDVKTEMEENNNTQVTTYDNDATTSDLNTNSMTVLQVGIDNAASNLYCCEKTPGVEQLAASDLSVIAGFYDIASSKMNKFVPGNQGLVRLCPNHSFEDWDSNNPDTEHDFISLAVYNNKCVFVDPVVTGGRVVTDPSIGCSSHLSLHLCLLEKGASEQVMQKVNTLQNVVFSSVFSTFFRLIRPLSLG